VSPNDKDLVELFAREYRRPKGAFAYGVSSRELSHNSFLHFMLGLGDAFSQRLVGELIAKADNGTNKGCRIVQIRKLTYNRAAIRGRPDEVAVVENDSGTTSALVVEMKVQAVPDNEQLRKYTLKDSSEVHDDNTHKMFLWEYGCETELLDCRGLLLGGCGLGRMRDLRPLGRYLSDGRRLRV
jgi:hypothetical protein